MELLATSADGTPIHAEISGDGATALVFVHGWLGSGRWWDAQQAALAADYTVVQVDLAGHGRSGRGRVHHSIAGYADDVVAVVEQLAAERVVLVGHSMSGAHVIVAGTRLPPTAMIVLVDTLKNLDQRPDPAQTEAMLALYRDDYAGAVANILPRFLFAPTTPPEIAARLQREFLASTGDVAAELVAPLYRDDYHTAARALRMPVRAINGDLHPTDVAANRRWLHDYEARLMPGVGHYPMLEQPDAFTAHLRAVLTELPR